MPGEGDFGNIGAHNTTIPEGVEEKWQGERTGHSILFDRLGTNEAVWKAEGILGQLVHTETSQCALALVASYISLERLKKTQNTAGQERIRWALQYQEAFVRLLEDIAQGPPTRNRMWQPSTIGLAAEAAVVSGALMNSLDYEVSSMALDHSAVDGEFSIPGVLNSVRVDIFSADAMSERGFYAMGAKAKRANQAGFSDRLLLPLAEPWSLYRWDEFDRDDEVSYYVSTQETDKSVDTHITAEALLQGDLDCTDDFFGPEKRNYFLLRLGRAIIRGNYWLVDAEFRKEFTIAPPLPGLKKQMVQFMDYLSQQDEGLRQHWQAERQVFDRN